MSTTQQQYKCSCCDGAINFDSKLQKMKCQYCGTEYEMETLVSYDNVLKNEQPYNMEWDATPGKEWQPGETEGVRIYACQSCSCEIVTDETTAATSCPFCRNPVVMMGQFKGVA